MRVLVALAMMALALAVEGCVTKSSHTEGDRQVNAQTHGAAEAAESAMTEARAELAQGSRGWTMLGLGLQAIADVKANAAQQEKVHGPPKEAPPRPTPRRTRMPLGNARRRSTSPEALAAPFSPWAVPRSGSRLPLRGCLGFPRCSRN